MSLYCTANLVIGLTVAVTGQAPRVDHQPVLADGPVLYLAERSLDLGTVLEGETAAGTFFIENRGNEDLVIESVGTSCGCTVAELSEEEKRIKPEETRPLSVTFNSKGKVGRQRNTVILTLNDPRTPRVVLVVKADVETLFHVLPSPLLVLRSARRGMALPPLEVFPTIAGTTLEKLEVDAPAGILTYAREPITNDAGADGVRLTFSVSPEIELGLTESKVKLRGVVDGKKAEVSIRVTGLVVGDLVVQPATIQSLSATPRGRKFAPLTVAATMDRPFKIKEVRAGPYLDVAYKPRKKGTEWTVRTTLREDVPDGPLAAQVIIRTDNDGQPLLTVPVFVNVRGRYRLEPAIVLLGGPGAKASVRVRVQRGDNRPLKISGLKVSDPRVKIQPEEAPLKLHDVSLFRVGLAEGAKPTRAFTAEALLTTNIPGAREVRIPVEYTPH